MSKILILYDTATGLILEQSAKDGSWFVFATGGGRIQGSNLTGFDLSEVSDKDQVVVTTLGGKRYFGDKLGKVNLPEDASTRLIEFPVDMSILVPHHPPVEVIDEAVSVEIRRWSTECSWSIQERIDAVATKEEELGEGTVGSIVVNTDKASVDAREWKVDLGTLHLVRRDDFQYE